MEKDDYITLLKNFLAIPHVYPSSNRRAYIAKIGLYYSTNNRFLVSEMFKDLKYLKKLLAENPSNENAEHLNVVISILEKYVELSREE